MQFQILKVQNEVEIGLAGPNFDHSLHPVLPLFFIEKKKINKKIKFLFQLLSKF